MSSQDFPDITTPRTADNPYPLSLSASDPLQFYEAEKALGILIIKAKMNQNAVSSKQFQEVLNELNLIANEATLPKNIKFALDQIIAQYLKAGVPEGNRVKIDLPKMQAILNVLQRS